jgi:hypothetical protein
MPVSAVNVCAAFRAAKQLRADYLESHGWEKSDDFPDKKQRWVKKFKGRELPLPSGSAFALERSLEQ